ncbi:hypothetical protein J3L12_13045 [Meiothermus sp. CFH 77666]|nr:hypothetical protein [Meiothermus sp. CFH 77666]
MLKAESQALIICPRIVAATPHPATAVTARIVLFGKRSTKLASAVATLSRKGRGKVENDKSLAESQKLNASDL